MDLCVMGKFFFIVAILFVMQKSCDMLFNDELTLEELKTDKAFYSEHENATITAKFTFPSNTPMSDYRFKWLAGYEVPFIYEDMYVYEDGDPEDGKRYQISLHSYSSRKGFVIIDITDLRLEDERSLKLNVLDKNLTNVILEDVVWIRVNESNPSPLTVTQVQSLPPPSSTMVSKHYSFLSRPCKINFVSVEICVVFKKIA